MRTAAGVLVCIASIAIAPPSTSAQQRRTARQIDPAIEALVLDARAAAPEFAADILLRLAASEAILHGQPANAVNIAEAAKQAVADAKPLPMTGYKLDLLKGVVQDLLGRLAA